MSNLPGFCPSSQTAGTGSSLGTVRKSLFHGRCRRVLGLCALAASFQSVAHAGAIRTAAPGTVVFHGGELILRWNYLNDRAAASAVDRLFAVLGASFSPSSNTLLDAEVPTGRVIFQDGNSQGLVGNVTLGAKYRFFRQVETWGDRQAAVRGSVELPTATAIDRLPPGVSIIQGEKLRLGSGRWNAHFGLSGAGARGRWVYGSSLEVVLRNADNGVKLGNEVRWSFDIERIVFPLRYQHAEGEVFFLLEGTLLHEGPARLQGAVLPKTGGSLFALHPGVQYVPSRRWVIEASMEVPVWKDFGSADVHRRGGLVAGVHWLY